MDTEQLIEQGKERLSALVAEQEDLRERLNSVHTEIAALMSELNTLHDLVIRFSPERSARQSEPPRNPWTDLDLTKAVLAALAEGNAPMGPKEIKTILKQHGREVEAPNISATLAYLKRRGAAINVDRGQWMASLTDSMTRIIDQFGPGTQSAIKGATGGD
jgi:hypothetical protein